MQIYIFLTFVADIKDASAITIMEKNKAFLQT